ncbi:MAG: hypothetical protein ACXQS2_06050 [Methermicoccaceae archaeon]
MVKGAKEKGKKVPAVLVQCYRLGFEVGYHGHSEIGWVSNRYNKLLSIASRTKLDSLAEDYYKRGKKDGEFKRNYDIQAKFYKHNIQDKKDAEGKPTLLWSMEKRMLDARFEGTSPIALRPAMLQFPRSLEMTNVLNIPKRLFGLKYLNFMKHMQRFK